MSSLPPTTFGLRSRNDCTSRVSRGRSCSCCSSNPREIDGLSSVMLLSASPATVTVSFTLPNSRPTSESGACGAQYDTGPLEFLEVLRDDLDPVGSRLQVWRFIAPLPVGLEGAGHSRRFVRDQYGCSGHDLSLGICDGTADRPEKRLCGGGRAEDNRDQEHEWRDIASPCKWHFA